jgi:hypothetical protein
MLTSITARHFDGDVDPACSATIADSLVAWVSRPYLPSLGLRNISVL